MKIIIDKINSEPKHSLSKSELQLILSKLPVDSINSFTMFKISAQMFSNSGWNRPVIFNLSRSTFNIMSRGLNKEYIVKELLIEIFSHYTKISFETIGNKLNIQQRNKLEEIITPYYQDIIKELGIN